MVVGSTCVLQCSELTFGETVGVPSPLWLVWRVEGFGLCGAREVLCLLLGTTDLTSLGPGLEGMCLVSWPGTCRKYKIGPQTHTKVVLWLRISWETFPPSVPTVTTQSPRCLSPFAGGQVIFLLRAHSFQGSSFIWRCQFQIPHHRHIQGPKTLFPVI